MTRRSSSAFGDLIGLLFTPLTWLLRLFIGREWASPGPVKWFYKNKEWANLRYAHLAKQPACVRTNIAHVKPLSYYWNLGLAPHNLQTLCANCDRGKGGRTGDHRHRQRAK